MTVVFLLTSVMVYGQNAEWIARYNGPANSGDGAEDIAVDNTGNVYVTGYSFGSGTQRDYATIKYNSSGDTVWVNRYDGPTSSIDHASACAVDAYGNVYVTGKSYSSVNDDAIATIKYNTDGVEQWVALYESSGDDRGHDIAVDASGNVYVTGWTYPGTVESYITIKYDSAGDTLWTARYCGDDSIGASAAALCLDDAGNVYVTGYSYATGESREYATVKYNSLGEEQWVRRYNNVAYYDDRAYAIECDGDYVYVTGSSEDTVTDDDFVTIKYSITGDTIWTARYDAGISSFDAAYALAIDSSGNVYVTGQSDGATTNYDYLTVKYASNGDVAWTAVYNGPDSASDIAVAIAVDGAENVYVTGYSYAYGAGTPENDYLTVMYDASGVEQWTSRYNGTGSTQDHPTALTIDSDGYVYVTGASIGSTGLEDFLTIKYSTVGIEEQNDVAINVSPLEIQPTLARVRTRLCFACPASAAVSLTLYDATGKLVKNIFQGYADEGCHELPLDCRKLSAGIYFVRFTSDAVGKTYTEKVVVLR
jgi:uncharacterized delta-60 repeat protein